MSALCEVIKIGKKEIDVTPDKRVISIKIDLPHTCHMAVRHVYNFADKHGRAIHQTFLTCKSCQEEDLLRTEILGLPLFY